MFYDWANEQLAHPGVVIAFLRNLVPATNTPHLKGGLCGGILIVEAFERICKPVLLKPNELLLS